MWRELMYKVFGLEPFPCNTCEVLRSMLDQSNRERGELLNKLLEKDKPEPVGIIQAEEPRSIQPAFTPWRVRQQMLESEDRKKAELMRAKEKEINELEKELGVASEK